MSIRDIQALSAGARDEPDEAPRRPSDAAEAASTSVTAPAEEPDSTRSSVSGTPTLLRMIADGMPYFGQGDAAADASIASTLATVPLEELDARDDAGNTLLLLVAMHGAPAHELVLSLLERGADAAAINDAGASALHFCCYEAMLDARSARALLSAGADANAIESSSGATPLHYAAEAGDVALCGALVDDGGADPRLIDAYGYTPAQYAEYAGHGRCARVLRERESRENAAELRALGGDADADSGSRFGDDAADDAADDGVHAYDGIGDLPPTPARTPKTPKTPSSARSLKRTETVEELLRAARDDAKKQFALGEDAST